MNRFKELQKSLDHITRKRIFKEIVGAAAERLANRPDLKLVSDERFSPLIIRYFRYTHDDGSIRGNGGAAVGIIIDYYKAELRIYPTICHWDDTFAKDKAREIIEELHRQDLYFVIPFYSSWPMGEKLPLTECVRIALANDEVYNICGLKNNILRTLKKGLPLMVG